MYDHSFISKCYNIIEQVFRTDSNSRRDFIFCGIIITSILYKSRNLIDLIGIVTILLVILDNWCRDFFQGGFDNSQR